MLTLIRPVGAGDREAAGPRRWGRLSAMGLALALIGGCGKSGPVPVYSVQGQVKVKGELASGAFLVFHPVGPVATASPVEGAPAEPVRPTALVKPDGSFHLTSFEGEDGAPAGDYAVTLQWNKTVIRNKAPEAGPNVVPPSYSKPETTPLKVSLKPEPTTLPAWDIR